MRLSDLYGVLYAKAERMVGRIVEADLPGGAAINIRIDPPPAGWRVIVSFSRVKKELGAVKLTTFRHHCNIPTRAQRWPEQGQSELRPAAPGGAPRYAVSYCWPIDPIEPPAVRQADPAEEAAPWPEPEIQEALL